METIDLHSALLAACSPVKHHCYADITDGHAAAGVLDGRALRADGRDLQLLLVSPVFEGSTVLERQRRVHAVLDPHIKSGRVHSVQMRCWTPDQWEQLGRPTDLGKPCTFASEADTSLPEPAPSRDLVLPPCTADATGNSPFAPAPHVSLEPSTPEAALDQPQHEVMVRSEPTLEMIVGHLREKSHTDARGKLPSVLDLEQASHSMLIQIVSPQRVPKQSWDATRRARRRAARLPS